MSFEVTSTAPICTRCGTAYTKRRGYFHSSYGESYKGTGFLHICKNCVEKMYGAYLAECGNPRDAVHRLCRKLDIYWNDEVFSKAEKISASRTVVTAYLSKLSNATYAGKSYDDTLLEAGTIWDFSENPVLTQAGKDAVEGGIDPALVKFWGSGLSAEMYYELEQKKEYWVERLKKDYGLTTIDIGTEALIKQACNLEMDINRDRAQGKNVDKIINAYNTVLGSMCVKPAQKKDEDKNSTDGNTPFGVWIKRWEDKRPIPEPDPEFQDVDGVMKYISVWFFGHLCKMLKIKNKYSRMYDEEIAKFRVEHPEYEDEDDEELLYDVLSADKGGEDDE